MARLAEDFWELLIRAMDPDFEDKLGWVDQMAYCTLDDKDKPYARLVVTEKLIERERCEY